MESIHNVRVTAEAEIRALKKNLRTTWARPMDPEQKHSMRSSSGPRPCT